jgi:hypothetical protein
MSEQDRKVADIRRYRSRHASPRAAPHPSPPPPDAPPRHRLNRSGNRTLNRVLYTMAITQIRADTEGRAYCPRKRAEGKTGREALRCPKRRLSDPIHKTMQHDLAAQGGECGSGKQDASLRPKPAARQACSPEPALRFGQSTAPTASPNATPRQLSQTGVDA